MLIGINGSELENIAERFRQAIEQTNVTLSNGVRLKLTASIGGTLGHPHIDIQGALSQIDDALYAVKRAGRNRVVIRNLPLHNTA